MVPKIDVFRCDGCGLCVKACPPQIMGLIQGKAVILADLCEECGICHEACPIHAVHFRLENLGAQERHPAYRAARDVVPMPGNWTIGVPRGHDGEGHSTTKE
jgi:MinD superfamily P-loop ATPase